MTAQGNAVDSVNRIGHAALKGRDRLGGQRLSHPFRAAETGGFGATQGVALGYHIEPFQGHEWQT